MPRTYSYDARCLDLAEYFLEDESVTDDQLCRLAQTIQDAIEDWLHELAISRAEEKEDRRFEGYKEP